jgi:hypothetical protein
MSRSMFIRTEQGITATIAQYIHSLGQSPNRALYGLLNANKGHLIGGGYTGYEPPSPPL